MEIIPAINCEDWECVEGRLKMASEFPARWVHFDVSDGKFAPVVTWNDPGKLKGENVNIEAHLMVVEPERDFTRWWEAGARRLVVHAEVIGVLPRRFIENVSDECEVGLALLPETSVEKVLPYITGECARLGFVQCLAVSPGFSGQKFQDSVLEKVRHLRAAREDLVIEVDGGVDLEVVKLLKKEGVDVVVSSSYIWDDEDPKRAFEKLGGV